MIRVSLRGVRGAVKSEYHKIILHHVLNSQSINKNIILKLISVVKSTCSSFRRLRFSFYNSNVSSRYVTPGISCLTLISKGIQSLLYMHKVQINFKYIFLLLYLSTSVIWKKANSSPRMKYIPWWT